MDKPTFILLILGTLSAFSCSFYDEKEDEPEMAHCKGVEYNFYSHYCSNGKIIAKDEFIDSRDGQKYRYVTIGSQIWMADNLNYDAEGSRCLYGSRNDLGDCETYGKYGKFYDWAMAMNINKQYDTVSYKANENHQGICPDGWHLPSYDEMEILRNYINYGTGDLKARKGWPKRNTGKSGNGTDDYGFSALPTGYFNYDLASFSAINYGKWWTSSESNKYDGDAFDMSNHTNSVDRGVSHKNDFLSVRCMKF